MNFNTKEMKSIKEIYKIGKGPSSSHTMGPYKAVWSYMENHPEADRLHVTLYGSLAATGKGHLTDVAIQEAFASWHCTDRDTSDSKERRKSDVEIEWKAKETLPVHPNGMKIAAVNLDGDFYDKWTYYSIGGGDIICMEHPLENDEEGDLKTDHIGILSHQIAKNGIRALTSVFYRSILVILGECSYIVGYDFKRHTSMRVIVLAAELEISAEKEQSRKKGKERDYDCS